MTRWHTITLTILRTRLVAVGEWCSTCALPAALHLEHLVTLNHGRPRYLNGWWCTECETGETEELRLE